MKIIIIRFEIGLGGLVLLWVCLVDPGSGPQQAIDLQPEQVGDRPPAADKRLLPGGRADQRRVVRVRGKSIVRDQLLHSFGIVGHDGR